MAEYYDNTPEWVIKQRSIRFGIERMKLRIKIGRTVISLTMLALAFALSIVWYDFRLLIIIVLLAASSNITNANS